MVKKATFKMYRLLPYGTVSRGVDLSMLGLVWPLDIAGPYKQDIIDIVQERLMREPFGFIRYDGDDYNGEGFTQRLGTEYPWLLGDCFMAHIEPNNPKWFNRLKAAEVHFGCMPEAYDPATLKPNRNTPLIWAEAMWDNAKRQGAQYGARSTG